MKKYLLFDLDGTLSDPKIGICTCVQYALASVGIEEPDLDRLEPFIGPPLKNSFMDFYHFDGEQADALVAKYRERYADVGLYENTIYPGIASMLRELQAKGMFLAVASSKPTVFVEKILEHFGIRQYFKAVVGSELDGTRVNKDEVINEALRRLFGEEKIDKSQIYMIGDRKFDVEGARKQRIESVAVTYGYGDLEELRAAKADYIVQSVEELRKFLLRGTDDAPTGLDLKRLWKTAYPLILFLLVKQFAVILVQAGFISLGGDFFGIRLLTFAENGTVNGVTGVGNGVLQIVGFIAGALAVRKGALIMIARAKDESKLLHLRKEPAGAYCMLALVSLGMMYGSNLFSILTNAVNSSAEYAEAAKTQYSVPLVLGILLYGAAAPIAEELLFRGIIYNGLKRSLKPVAAIALSAAIFGGYHGNAVQGIYGFVMGCLLIYAYEYFGDIKVPIAMHMILNLLSFLTGDFLAAHSLLASWPACLICFVVAGVGLFGMISRKRILHS